MHEKNSTPGVLIEEIRYVLIAYFKLQGEVNLVIPTVLKLLSFNYMGVMYRHIL